MRTIPLEPIAGVIGLALFAVFLVWMSLPAPKISDSNITSISRDTLYIRLEGCTWECNGHPLGLSLSIRNGSSWRTVNTNVGSPTGYYRDGGFAVSAYDCVVEIGKIPYPMPVRLVEYVQIGEKAPPADYKDLSGERPSLVPEYRSYPLEGEIKVEMKYWADNCTDARNFVYIFTR